MIFDLTFYLFCIIFANVILNLIILIVLLLNGEGPGDTGAFLI